MIGLNNIMEKVDHVETMNWGTNTIFQKVFDIVLKVSKRTKLRGDQMLKRIFLFSDMEFDKASANPSMGERLKGHQEEVRGGGLRWCRPADCVLEPEGLEVDASACGPARRRPGERALKELAQAVPGQRWGDRSGVGHARGYFREGVSEACGGGLICSLSVPMLVNFFFNRIKHLDSSAFVRVHYINARPCIEIID